MGALGRFVRYFWLWIEGQGNIISGVLPLGAYPATYTHPDEVHTHTWFTRERIPA